MPPQRSHFGLSRSALRDAAKLLALGKAAGYDRVTIHGAIFESTQLKQDSPDERKKNVHGHNKLSKEGTVQHDDATTGENAGRGTSVRSGAASARQKRSMNHETAPGPPGTLSSSSGFPEGKAAAAAAACVGRVEAVGSRCDHLGSGTGHRAQHRVHGRRDRRARLPQACTRPG